MSDEQIRVRLPETVRKRILGALHSACQKDGCIEVKTITPKILTPMGINWRTYAAGEKLGEWLDKYYPEYERSEDGTVLYPRSTSAPVVRKKVPPEVHSAIASILNEAFCTDQSISLSELGTKLIQANIDRREYTNEGLADWIIRLFPELTKGEGRLNRSGTSAQKVTVTAAEPTYPPAEQSLSEIDLDEDIRQMHSIAFMGWWSTNVKQLKRLTGCTGNDTRIWSGIIAQKMSEVFLGGGSVLRDDMEDGTLRIAFYAGMDTAQGAPIYCIMTPNANNESGKYQPMRLEAISWPGDEENPELGAWLKTQLSARTAVQAEVSAGDVAELETLCRSLQDQRSLLIRQTRSVLQELEADQIAPITQVPDLGAYGDTCRRILGLRESLNVPQELTCAEQLLLWCAQQNPFESGLKAVELAFEQVQTTLELILSQNRITVQLQPDREMLRLACESYPRQPQTDTLRQAVLPYGKLLEIMGSMIYDQTVIGLTGELDRHFGFATIQVFGLKMRDPEQFRLLQSHMAALDSRIGVLEELSVPQLTHVQSERNIPTSWELLGALGRREIAAIWTAGGGNGTLEALILEDRLPEAQSFAYDRQAMAQAGYTEEERAQIVQRLNDLQDLPEGHTIYSAGLRISRILGKRSETGERYLLMGLFLEPEGCAAELLQLYRETDQAEKFMAVWQMFGSAAKYDLNNEIYYLRHLQGAAPEQLRAYLDSRVYLYYLPDSVSVIREVCPDMELPATETVPCNALEQALVEDDHSRVLELLDSREALSEMGYSPEQITQISQAAISDLRPVGTAAYQTGMRLCLYQGNLHGLAERYLWQGLALEQTPERSDMLLRLLAEERRWTECIRLYHCCGSESGNSAESRQAYLLAMLHAEPIRAQQLIRSHLQDFLSLVYQNPNAAKTVEGYRDSSNDAFRAFYESAFQLTQLLEEEFPRSVMLHNRSLRELVTQPALLSELGLEDKQIECARTLYQSGSYPQGTDAVSVAKRTYAFLGTYHGIAEKLSRFALPGEGGPELLWTICAATGDTQEQRLLLQNYASIQESHPEEYGQYLFETAQYELFLDWVRLVQPNQFVLIQQAIAKLILRPEEEIDLPSVTEPVSAKMIDCLILLSGTLVRLNRMEDLEVLLLPNFDVLLRNCSAEALKRIMTADGKLTLETAIKLQSNALAQSMELAALYYYNIMGVGDLVREADAYYAAAQAASKEESDQNRLDILSKLYPGRSQELNERMYLLKVYELLESDPAAKDVPVKLAQCLDECHLDPAEIRRLMKAVGNSPFADKTVVVQSIMKLTDREDLRGDGLLYVHQQAMAASKRSVSNEFLYEALCRLYMDALDRGRFPAELGAEAQSLCRRIIRGNRKLYSVMLCLHHIHASMGQHHRADYILRHLLTQPANALGDKLYGMVLSAAEDRWGGKIPSALTLFRAVLLEAAPEQILSYCQFCSIFCEAADEDRSAMHIHIQNMRQQKLSDATEPQEYSQCSEDDGEALVKVLCSAPDKPDYWWACTSLPGLQPKSRGKLLFTRGMINPALWQECLQFCVEWEHNDLLLQALNEWVRTAESGPKNCRTYLGEALIQDPDFFGRWPEPDDIDVLLEILERICADLTEDMVRLPNNVAHSALNAVSTIVVGLKDDRATQIMDRYLSEPMLTGNSEVGVATVLRLLLTGQISYARHLLDGLNQSSFPITCRRLVEYLGAMSEEALANWVKKHESQMLIEMLLPNGNRPAALDIQTFAMNMLKKHRVQEGVNVLNMLLDLFPGDYVCYGAVFALCKCGVENPVPLLHKCLCGLISGSANGTSYYRRSYEWNAKLLAGINAIVKAKHLEAQVLALGSDYDFNQSAGNYCLNKKPEITADQVKEINRIQRDLSNDLQNLRSDALEDKCAKILCWVTGNWADFLYNAWQQRQDDADISGIRDALRMELDQKIDNCDSIGFCRELLMVSQRLDQSQRIEFLKWVHLGLTGVPMVIQDKKPEPWNLSGKLRHVYTAMDLISKGVLQNLGDLPLHLPAEEYTLMPLIFDEYIEPHIGQNAKLLYYRLWYLGAVVDSTEMMKHQVSNIAVAAFARGDDLSSAAFYEVMLRLLDRGILAKPPIYAKRFHSFKARYEANSRISRAFLGDQEILRKISSQDFNPWSCINMTVTMLITSRGNQAMQLASHFTGINRRLAHILIRGVNPNVPDQVKLNLIRDFPDGEAKAYLTYVMGYGSSKGGVFRSYFFADTNNSWTVRKKSQMLAKRYPNNFNLLDNGNVEPRRTVMTISEPVNDTCFEQLPVIYDPMGQMAEEVVEKPAAIHSQPAQVPAFAKDLTALRQQEEADALEDSHSRLPHLKRYYRERLQLSEQLYRIRLAETNDPVKLLPALIDFGMDYYDYHMDLNSPEELSLASGAITQLVLYVDQVRIAVSRGEDAKLDAAINKLETAVENTVVYNLLGKGHLTIQNLIDRFITDREALSLMQKMVRMDKLRRDTVDVIYSALDDLADCYTNNASNHVVCREGLIKARNALSNISYGAWQPLKNDLLGLIHNEVNSMDRRPILSMQILNRGWNAEDDYLYGEIQNDGQETAEDITIQLTYGDSSSECYRLSQLAKGESNAFKIRYTLPQGTQSLRYVLSWTYMFRGVACNQPPIKKVIPIAPLPEPTFPLGQYETQTITDFFEDSNGKLGNPNFFGREKETAELRNLFRSGRFPSYNNAIVYGIRRAGKTTLLNYVQKYVSLHCDDAIVVKVDCLNNASSRLVQSLFIDRVLNAIQGRYPQYKELQGWQQLCVDWKLPVDHPTDRDPEDLELFYQELKQVTGKGLILMLDEVDNFFTAVEQQTSLDSHLFQVLSNMLCNPSSQECIHFIFCGSKYLLRYRTGDGGLSQLFQRFGSNIIEVGLIPKSEMRKMLLKPYEEYPEVQITEEAINWIWNYTQGLVWHVKLLANMVLQHVRDNGRTTVYPVDVKSKIRDIVQKEYCEQFFDGINEKNKDRYERLVVDALQSQASTRNLYIPRSRLFQILTSEALPPEYRMTADQIENALDNLIKLRLVGYSDSDKGYRFQVDLYRLYFRSQREYPFVFKKTSETEPTFTRV